MKTAAGAGLLPFLSILPVTTPTPPDFHEEQRFRQPWIWLLIFGIAALQWWGWVQQIWLGQPFGDNPAPDWMMWLFWAIFGIGFPLFFRALRLVIDVGTDGIKLRYWPLTQRHISFEQIAHCQVEQDYHPLTRYGGWGIRGVGKDRAYSVSGKQGVRLTLHNGDRLVIGTPRAGELALAVEAHLPPEARRILQ